MNRHDKLLLSIVSGIVILIITTFIIVLQPTDPVTYKTDDSAENSAFNYFLALQKEEYARAYQYVSPDIVGYPPTAAEFTQDIRSYCYQENSSFSIQKSQELDSPNSMLVTLGQITYNQSPNIFGSSSYTNEFSVYLTKVNNNWLITQSDYCWNYSWTNRSPTP